MGGTTPLLYAGETLLWLCCFYDKQERCCFTVPLIIQYRMLVRPLIVAMPIMVI
jgi:hypothetical protein